MTNLADLFAASAKEPTDREKRVAQAIDRALAILVPRGVRERVVLAAARAAIEAMEETEKPTP